MSDINDVFEGIDLANGIDRLGRCLVHDNGNTLEVLAADPPMPVLRTAIDCPFGTTVGFEKLLRGERPGEESTDGFKSRVTERWLSAHVNNFQIVQRWRNRTPQERQRHPREPFFNSGGHIQPTLRMSIVPECLWYIANRVQRDVPVEKRLEELKGHRRGEGRWIEAHPRMFLYSLIERLYRADHHSVNLETLFATARYKRSAENRRQLYQQLREQRVWMGNNVRDIHPTQLPEELAEDDHRFDSFLCALTAWAHQHSDCISWQVAGMTREIVDVEGHILVLK